MQINLIPHLMSQQTQHSECPLLPNFKSKENPERGVTDITLHQKCRVIDHLLKANPEGVEYNKTIAMNIQFRIFSSTAYYEEMSTYTQIVYQIVFSTKHREKTLTKEILISAVKYISGILKRKNCHLYQINGVDDHIHIVTHIHPSVALANLVKAMKVSTSKYIKETFPRSRFSGWQTGYAAFTYSQESIPNLIQYVENQEKHHTKKSSREELIDLLQSHQLDYEEKYLL